MTYVKYLVRPNKNQGMFERTHDLSTPDAYRESIIKYGSLTYYIDSKAERLFKRLYEWQHNNGIKIKWQNYMECYSLDTEEDLNYFLLCFPEFERVQIKPLELREFNER